MKLIKFFRYLIEFLIIMILFLIFKIIGVKISSYVSGKVFRLIGPLLRPKKTILNNFKIALPHASANEIKNHISEMWNYYGRILAEYSFLNNFRNNSKTEMIKIKGQEILDNIIKNNENVIFVSGHFDNFELMAMTLEKSGIKLRCNLSSVKQSFYE